MQLAGNPYLFQPFSSLTVRAARRHSYINAERVLPLSRLVPVEQCVIAIMALLVLAALGGCAISPSSVSGALASQPQASPTELSLTIREPANGSVLPSPVHLVAEITGRPPNTRVEVLVNSAVVSELSENQQELQLPLLHGKHTLTIRATDARGRLVETAVSVRVPAARFAYASSIMGDVATISGFVVDRETGELIANSTAPNAVFGPLAISPRSNYLYAGGRPPASFSINQQNGQLTLLSAGDSGGFRVALTIDPQGRFAFNSWADMNAMLGYTIDPQSGAPILPGSWVFTSICCGGPFGPTQGGILAISKDGRFAYWGHGPIEVLSIDPISGAMTAIQHLEGLGGAPSQMVLTPRGQFLYASSEFSGQLWGFSVDAESGQLSPISGTPIGLPRGGLYSTLAVSDAFVFASSNSGPDVFSFKIDPHTGRLTPVSTAVSVAQPFARWLRIDPSGHYLYASTDTGIEIFAIEQQRGTLRQVNSIITPGAPHRIVFAGDE